MNNACLTLSSFPLGFLWHSSSHIKYPHAQSHHRDPSWLGTLLRIFSSLPHPSCLSLFLRSLCSLLSDHERSSVDTSTPMPVLCWLANVSLCRLTCASAQFNAHAGSGRGCHCPVPSFSTTLVLVCADRLFAQSLPFSCLWSRLGWHPLEASGSWRINT